MAILYNEHIIYDAWLSLFTPQQQTSFKKCIEKMSKTEISRWMCQFATEESTKEFIEELTTAYDAESLIVKRALSMHTCPIFKVEKKCTIAHASIIKSVTFSADSLHLVIINNNATTKLYRQDSTGQWVLKIILSPSLWETPAIFSADDSHVITFTINETAIIYGQESNGEWRQKDIIQCPAGHHPTSAIFSPDSHHAMFTIKTNTESTVQIYRRDSNDEWAQRASINHDGNNITAIFSPDSRNVLITACDGATQIYAHDSSGDTWTKKDTPELNKTAVLATFSADSSHVAIIHKADSSTGIYGQDLNGNWTQKILINNNNLVYPSPIKPAFSNDGRFVMTISGGDNVVKICGKSSSVKWTEKATSQHESLIQSMTFSPDSRHMMISDWGGTVQIYSKMANDQWTKQATIQYKHEPDIGDIVSAFSADSRQMLAASTIYSNITIYRWTSEEGWIESYIDTGVDTPLKEATFSADGSHMIIIATDIIKIYGLNSTDYTWKEKAHIKHIGVEKASFSADGGHVVTVDRSDGIVKIWRLSRKK